MPLSLSKSVWALIFVCLLISTAFIHQTLAEQRFELDLKANWYQTLSPFPQGYDLDAHRGLFGYQDNAGIAGVSVMNDVATDAGGNAYALMTAFQGSRTKLAFQFVLLKFDANGKRLWHRSLGDLGRGARAYDLAVDANGNIYVVGNYPTDETDQRTNQGFVICFSPAGKKRWSFRTDIKKIGRSARFTAVAIDKDSVYIAGNTGKGDTRGQATYDLLVTRLTLKGRHAWTRTYPEDGQAHYDSNYSLTVTPQGTVCVASNKSYRLPRSGTVGYAFAIDKSGKKLWATAITPDLIKPDVKDRGGTSSSGLISITNDAQSNLYVTGKIGPRPFLTKLAPKGKILWTREISEAKGIATKFWPNCVRIGPEGNIWITGGSDDRPAMLCYDRDGKVKSVRIYSQDGHYTSSDFDFLPGTTPQAVIWGKYDPSRLANKDPNGYGPQYFLANINLDTPNPRDE